MLKAEVFLLLILLRFFHLLIYHLTFEMFHLKVLEPHSLKISLRMYQRRSYNNKIILRSPRPRASLWPMRTTMFTSVLLWLRMSSLNWAKAMSGWVDISSPVLRPHKWITDMIEEREVLLTHQKGSKSLGTAVSARGLEGENSSTYWPVMLREGLCNVVDMAVVKFIKGQLPVLRKRFDECILRAHLEKQIFIVKITYFYCAFQVSFKIH